MRAVAVLLVGLVVGCGDNDAIDPSCETGSGELPAEGMFVDPNEIALAPDCVVGGLADLPGRWFVSVPTTFFSFEYPQYEGTCKAGFNRTGSRGVDHDLDDDDVTRYVWNDGTRYVERVYQRYGFGGQLYEYVKVTALCMMPDDTLSVGYIRYDSDRGETRQLGKATRFAQKDEIGSGLEYVGELGPKVGAKAIYGLNLIVEDNIAYVVGTTGLDTIDVSDPAHPVQLGHLGGYLNDVRIVHGNGKIVAFGASEAGDDRVWVIDVTDPAVPVLATVIDQYAHSVQVRANGPVTELYLANYSPGVPRFDVTDPLNPLPLGVAALPGQTLSGVHDLTVYGNHLYVNNTDAGFVAVDTTNSFAQPTEVGRKISNYSHASWAGQINGQEIVLHGDEGLAGADGAAFMRVLDGNPASPTYMMDIGRYASRREVGIHNIEVHGTRAYISYYHDGIRIVDLADPTNPVEVAHYNTWDFETGFGAGFEGAVGVRKVGDYVYVADLERGLIILREL